MGVMVSTPQGHFGRLSEAPYRVPAECLFVSLSSFSARQMNHPCCFSFQQPSPTTLGQPAQALPLRQVCHQADATPSTRIVCSVSFGNCVPWWLRILATTRRPRSSRTFFGKVQQEVGPRTSWMGFSSEELRAVAGFIAV